MKIVTIKSISISIQIIYVFNIGRTYVGFFFINDYLETFQQRPFAITTAYLAGSSPVRKINRSSR